jgi:glycosyltransferase involved in cell wall biosynthesis
MVAYARLKAPIRHAAMTQPLVSVIVPTYNCAAYVRSAIDSVLAQSYAPIEVVVVDDGSTDDTLAVLSEFGDRIRVFSQANAGPAAARNRAVAQARGEYLAFLDGDDLWLPGHLAGLVRHLIDQPDARVAFADWLVWHANADGTYPPIDVAPRALRPDPAASGWLYTRLLFDSVIHIIACVIHRSVYEAVNGFDESLRTGSDYDFWLKVSRRYPVAKLDGAVAVYRQNPQSVTYRLRTEDNAYRLLSRAIAAYGVSDEAGNRVEASAIAARLAHLSFVHGYRHFWDGDPAIAARSFMQAVRHRPMHGKALLYLLASAGKRVGRAFTVRA